MFTVLTLATRQTQEAAISLNFFVCEQGAALMNRRLRLKSKK